jgi:hypothetical protein
MKDVFSELLIKIGIPILLAIIFAIARLKLGASKEEQIFTNSSMNLLRKFLIAILAFVISSLYFGSITSFNLQEGKNKFHIFSESSLFNVYTAIFTLILFTTMLLVMTLLKNRIRNLIFNLSIIKRATALSILLLIPFISTLLCSLYYGFSINEVVAYSNILKPLNLDNTFFALLHFNKIVEPNNIIIVILSCLYALTLWLHWIFLLFISKQKVTAYIVLKDGTELKDKYIINYNLDNSVLISSWEGSFGEDKILIPKANIQYIKFNRIGYMFNHLSTSRILDPKNITDKEFEELKKKLFTSSNN